MKKTLQIGDLVWYNVGGNGKETVGLVIDYKKIFYRHRSPWEDKAKVFENCVRIKWMRKGKLAPKPLALPLYESHYAVLDSDPAPSPLEENPHAIYEDNWYPGHYFKIIGAVETK